MLDDLSKRILKYMKTDSDNHSQKNYDFDADLEKMAQAVSAEKEAVRAAVRYLEENGYIKYLRTNSGYTKAPERSPVKIAVKHWKVTTSPCLIML